MKDLPDPQGFQHPAQAAYVWSGGFDAVVVTVHLSWTDTAMREKEKQALKGVVSEALKTDPDVLVVGDFNTKEDGIQELAQATGLVVMVPAGQDGVGTTYAGNRYDHFLVSPDLASEEAVGAHIETFAGDDLAAAKETSDHMPVTTRFRTDERFRDKK
jgi:endonuclease/exonuclease/phosphatase family metal-dependent hydrolase